MYMYIHTYIHRYLLIQYSMMQKLQLKILTQVQQWCVLETSYLSLVVMKFLRLKMQELHSVINELCLKKPCWSHSETVLHHKQNSACSYNSSERVEPNGPFDTPLTSIRCHNYPKYKMLLWSVNVFLHEINWGCISIDVECRTLSRSTIVLLS